MGAHLGHQESIRGLRPTRARLRRSGLRRWRRLELFLQPLHVEILMELRDLPLRVDAIHEAYGHRVLLPHDGAVVWSELEARIQRTTPFKVRIRRIVGRRECGGIADWHVDARDIRDVRETEP